MMKASALQLVLTLAVAGGVMRCQDASDARLRRQDLLANNIEQLRFSVGLDRSTPYFPGETGTITVTLTNPTSAPLQILDPTAPGVASFTLSIQGGPFTKDKSEGEWFQARHAAD
jgi:hypothetical protein